MNGRRQQAPASSRIPPGSGPWLLVSHRLVGADRVRLELEGGGVLEVDAEAYYRRGWSDGQEISREDLADLVRADVLKYCKNKAVRYLSYRLRTEAEMRSYLARLGQDAEIIAETVSWLKQQRLLDDAEFAARWIESRLASKPVGRRRLLAELIQKGIDRQLAEAKLAELEDLIDDEEQALAAAAEQVRRYRRDHPAAKRRKLFAFLQRRGFSSEAARKAVERVLSCEPGEADHSS